MNLVMFFRFRVLDSYSFLLILMLFLFLQVQEVTAQEIPLTQQIREVANREFRKWIVRIPDDQIEEFGFANRKETLEAKTLAPLPSFMPERKSEKLTRVMTEKVASGTQKRWRVPISVQNRIVCLVTVRLSEKNTPEAIEYGKTYAANRLDAAYRLLGWPAKQLSQQMSVISFYSPVYQILLQKNEKDGWTWINLTGTTIGQAQVMSSSDISAVLDTLKSW